MSGKQSKKKRRDVAAKTVKAPEARKPELALPTPELRLDLACGQNCREGFEGVDLPGTRTYLAGELERLRALPTRTGEQDTRIARIERSLKLIKHELDLTKFPWPWADNSVIELHSSHFVEHLPMIYVDARGNEVPHGTPGSKDLFFAFFDECYRVLAPGAWLTVVVPCLRNNRAFQDPTHRRFYPQEAFYYLFRTFREINGLDHYNVVCNFDGSIDPTVQIEMNSRSPDVQQRMFNECWNSIIDWIVRLKAIKEGPQLAKEPPRPDLSLPAPS